MKTAKPEPPSRKSAAKKPVAGKSTTAVRGKYFNQLPRGTNLAIIDPEIQEHFPDSESVNKALRAFLAIREQLQSATPLERAA